MQASAAPIFLLKQVSECFSLLEAVLVPFSVAGGSAEDAGLRYAGRKEQLIRLLPVPLLFQLPVNESVKIFIRKVHGLPQFSK